MHVKILQKKWICWKYVTRKCGFVELRSDNLYWNSWIAWQQSILSVNLMVYRLRIRLGCKRSWVQFHALALIFMFASFVLLLLYFYFFVQNTLFVIKFAIPFAMLIHLVYLTDAKMCDLLNYKGTKIQT